MKRMLKHIIKLELHLYVNSTYWPPKQRFIINIFGYPFIKDAPAPPGFPEQFTIFDKDGNYELHEMMNVSRRYGIDHIRIFQEKDMIH